MSHNNIILIGPMAAGKSTIGRKLAQALGWAFYDSDEVVEARAGVDTAWIFDVEGEAGFRRRESAVIDELTQKSRIVLATGGGAIVSAQNRQWMAARGTVIYLSVPVDIQVERLLRDNKRPLAQGADRKAQLRALAAERDALYAEIACHTLISHGQSLDKAVGAIRGLLET